MTAELAGNVMFVLIVVTGGVIVHQAILHTNPYAAVRPVGIFVLTTNGTMLIKTERRQHRGSGGVVVSPPDPGDSFHLSSQQGTGGR